MPKTIIALIPFALLVSGAIPSTFMLKVHCFIDSEVHALLQYVLHFGNSSSRGSSCYYEGRAKFFNFCGLPSARLDADKTVYFEDTGLFHPLTITILMILNAMLFGAPRAYYQDIRRVWVDEYIIVPRWKGFIGNLMAELNRVTIYVCTITINVLFQNLSRFYFYQSTVMLAVDVSFLAVPNVNVSTSQSIGVIANYISTIFIIESLIFSLLLARQAQKYELQAAVSFLLWQSAVLCNANSSFQAELMSNKFGDFLGMNALATFLSLPSAMVMWG
jgi:hypothetical protein